MVVPRSLPGRGPFSPPDAGRSGPQLYVHDGQMWAHDPAIEAWYRFQGDDDTPEPVAPGLVPAALRSGDVAPLPAPTVADPAEREARTERALAAAEGTNGELRINALLAEEAYAQAVLEVLDGLVGVEVPGEVDLGRPVLVWFDARCPYCHAAYARLEGRIRMKWLPTDALGPGADAMTAGILGAVTAERDEEEIVSVSAPPDAERPARLALAMTAQAPDTEGPVDEAIEYVIAENMVAMRELYGERQQHLIAVPTILVPHPDGTARMYRGFDDEVLEAITAAGSEP